MKFVGIVREHEKGPVKIGKPLSEYHPAEKLEMENYQGILSYLDKGTVLMAFLHYVHDSMNNPLVPLIIYTDGKWLWPGYLAYYLRLYRTFLLPEEFIENIKDNNFSPSTLNQLQIAEAERFYLSTYDPGHKSLLTGLTRT